MKVKPELSAKILSQCKSGELIRFKQGLCLVADKGLIRLETGGGDTAPYYTLQAPQADLCLSYGHDYYFRVAATEQGISSLIDKFLTSGAMLVGLHGIVIRFKHPESKQDNIFYHVNSGMAEKSWNDGEPLALLNWQIYLTSDRDDAPPLFSFAPPSAAAGP